jgi:outer membrane protein TolC
MKYLTILLLPALLFGDTLKVLLEYAQENNNLLHASKRTVDVKKSELSTIQSNYYPKIDMGLFYQRDDEATPFYPGTTYGAKAKISYELYDGGKKSSLKEQKKAEIQSAKYSQKDDINTIFLSITKNFYNLKTVQGTLHASEESANAVKAQLIRIKQFYKANLATSDDIDRLQSAYDRNTYTIESLKFTIFSLEKSLELQVGKEIDSIEDSKFQKKIIVQNNQLDSIKALSYKQKALKHLANSIDTNYSPTLNIEDTYTLFGYEDKPYFANKPIELLDSQNTIKAILNIRIYDAGVITQKEEVVKLQTHIIEDKIIYKKKEQVMQQKVAYRRIQTARLNIKSSHSALISASNALQTITQKYQAGIVDNIIYLDALSSKTEAQALYEKSQNNLEIAYAIYYYFSAKNLEEFLQ